MSLVYSDRQKEDDPLIGRVINKVYRIDKKVGEGAMGRVYLAQDIHLRKQVALKILRPNLVEDPIVVKRFEREGQAASRLNHPNTISIYGCGQEDDGLLWIAMEFVQGPDLGTIIATEWPLPTMRIIHIFRQICSALDEAHTAKVIHRDLKPANIVCFNYRHTRDFVKVLDFGIAKIIDPDADYQPLTREGIVCGTPAYMSPEQVQGFELDNRSDLFSLGIMLYQTLTGQLPFLAESPVEIATKIVMEAPKRPSSLHKHWPYPRELEELALKLLQKKKEDRFADAHLVKNELDRIQKLLESQPGYVADYDPEAPPPEKKDELSEARTVELKPDAMNALAAASKASNAPTSPAITEPSKSVLSTEHKQTARPQKSMTMPLVIGLAVGLVVIGVLAFFVLK